MAIDELLYKISLIVGLIAGFFVLSDRFVKESINRRIKDWLISFWVQAGDASDVAIKYQTKWTNAFISSFDIFFGTALFSWKRIRNSWAISTGSVIALTIVWWVIRPEEFQLLHSKTQSDITGLFQGVIITAYILNLIPDYFSAIQTRWLIGKAAKAKSMPIFFLLVLTDIILTGLVFFVFIVIFINIFSYIYGLSKEIRSVWDILAFSNPKDVIGLLINQFLY